MFEKIRSLSIGIRSLSIGDVRQFIQANIFAIIFLDGILAKSIGFGIIHLLASFATSGGLLSLIVWSQIIVAGYLLNKTGQKSTLSTLTSMLVAGLVGHFFIGMEIDLLDDMAKSIPYLGIEQNAEYYPLQDIFKFVGTIVLASFILVQNELDVLFGNLKPFKDVVKTCFQKSFTIQGRASRSEYWGFALFFIIAQIVLAVLFFPLALLFLLAVTPASCTVGIRRLHDLDKSGWLILIAIIPIIGGLVLLYWSASEGQPRANQYGAVPFRRLSPKLTSLRAKSIEISSTINTPRLRKSGLVMLSVGVGAILVILDDVWALNLLGWERIYIPVGDSGAFVFILLGLSLVLLGMTFLSFDGKFSAKKMPLQIIPPIAITMIFVAGGYPISGDDSVVDLLNSLISGHELEFSFNTLIFLIVLSSAMFALGNFATRKISLVNPASSLIVLLTLIVFFQHFEIDIMQARFRLGEIDLMNEVASGEESAIFALVGTAAFLASITRGRKITLNPWNVRPLNSIATLYTDFFRNTPLIVQFMFIHFGVGIGLKIQKAYEGNFGDLGTDGLDYFFLGQSAFISAIFTLGLNSGAYQCETIRGAIAAIPTGQMEAGRSIGLTYMGTMRLVILPQAIRICIPPLGNEMVNLVLNSSLAMVIGYSELARQGRLVIAVTFQIFWAWGMVMISYFVITWTLALLLRRLEEKTKIPGLGITGGD